MSYSRSVFAAAIALCAAVPSTAAAYVPAPAVVELSASGQRALKQSSLSVSASSRSTKTQPRLMLMRGKTTLGSSATVELAGALRFTSGKRTANATALKLTIGRSTSYVTAKLAKKTVRLLTIKATRPVELNPSAGRLSVTGARIALTPAAAKALRKTLKLKRTPPTSTLGTFSLTVAPPPSVAIDNGSVSTPLPAAPAPTATPASSATATPTPDPTEPPSCDPARYAATPAGSVDWFSCDLPGNRDLRSWTRYVLTPAAGCSVQPPSIVASGGATRLDPVSAYDHRFTITSNTPGVDLARTIQLAGSITYSMPAHGIDEAITNLKIEIDRSGQTGSVYASGRSAARNGIFCVTAPETYTDQKVMDLDLSGSPLTGGRYIRVPAKVTAPAERLGGGEYGAGQPWGTFTIALPAVG
ncbi:Htaa protein [Solirubrobacter pauli]|uniref:Htaa protein n=1 Tax=Solirubrobacter pauli TaxID=166793 RepID=A0A660LED8_9ACTN|nr:HtaA domain-containing protein [Solirubrobacter pauli]RKQ92676.1 Htaa protein [Solirubrobacter pauli]